MNVRRILALVLGALGFALVGGAALAHLIGTGAGTASATVATLDAPSGVSASSTVGSGTVAVSWTGVTAPDGTAVDGYLVERLSGSDAVAACGSSLGAPVTGTSCDDESVADGTYRYRVTTALNGWTAASAPSDGEVTVVNDNTAPGLVELTMLDRDVDGRVDAVEAEFDEDLAAYTAGTTPWTLTGAPSGATLDSVTLSPTTGDTLVLALVEGTGPKDTAVGAFTVALAADATGVRDAAGNRSSFDATAPADGAAPVVTAATRADTSPTAAKKVAWNITLSEAVTGVDSSDVQLPDLTLSVDSLVVGGVSGRITYTATALDIVGNGNLTLEVLDDDTIEDAAGNELAGATDGSFTGETYEVDQTVPATPAALVLGPADDTGLSETDGITNVSAPFFFGEGTADGWTVTVYDDGVPIQSTPVSGATYSLFLSALLDGPHSLTVTFTSRAGAESAPSEPLDLVIDTTAPTPAAPDLVADSDSGSSDEDDYTNVTLPTFTGTTDPGMLTLRRDTNVVLGSFSNTTGTYTVTALVASPDLTGDFQVEVTDVAGNQGVSPSRTVTIDTVAPEAPSTPDLDEASDTGSSTIDDVTNDATPEVAGTAEVDATVEVLEGAEVRGSGPATDGAYWVTTETLADGAHDLWAQAVDRAGNVSGSSTAALTVTIDTAAPATPAAPDLTAATDTGASDIDDLTNSSTPTLVGVVEPGATVTLNRGGLSAGSVVAGSDGSYSIVSTPSGSSDYTIRVTDPAGNDSAASPVLTVVVDRTAPSAPVTAPDLVATSDSGRDDDNVTNDSTPTFVGTAPTDTRVELVVDGAVVASANVVSGTYSFTWSTPVQGSFVVQFRFVDPAGNASSLSPTLTLTIDTVAPVAPSKPNLDNASDSNVFNDDITTDTTPSFSGTASPNGATVELLVGTAVKGTGPVSFNLYSGITVTAPVLSDGVHSVTARVVDQAGNVSPASDALSITIDTVAPAPDVPDLVAASDSGSRDDDHVTNDTTPTFTGTTEVGSVQLLRNGASSGPAVTMTAAGDYSVTAVANGANGTVSFSVRVTDVAGNVGTSPTLAVTIDTIGPAVPSVPDLTDASDSNLTADNLTKDSTPTFAGTTVAGTTVQIVEDTVVWGSALSTTTAYAVTTDVLPDGAHVLRAKAVDLAGNSSTSSTTSLTVTIDTVVPATPPAPDLAAGSDLGFSNTDDLTADNTPTFGGTVEPWVEVRYPTGPNSYYNAGVQANGNYSIELFNGIPDGVHQLAVHVVDGAGNVSATGPALAVTVETVRPPVPSLPDMTAESDLGHLSDDNWTSDDTPTFVGTVSEPGVRVQLMQVSGCFTFLAEGAESNGTYSVTLPPTPNGEMRVCARSMDEAGNVSAATPAMFPAIFKLTLPALAAPDLRDDSDTGVSTVDNITKDTTPTFTGATFSNNRTTLYEGTTVLGSGANYPITTSVLADGTHTIHAERMDVFGNVVVSGTTTITIDTVAPQITNVELLGTGAFGRPNTNDKVVIDFSEAPASSGFCSTWANDELDKLYAPNDLLVHVDAGNQQVRLAGPASCVTSATLGEILTGTHYGSSGVWSFGRAGTPSSVSWSPTSRRLTITLGGLNLSVAGGFSQTGPPSITPSASIVDIAGNAVGAYTDPDMSLF